MDSILTHPVNIPFLEKALEKECQFDRIRFRVYADEYLEPNRWTGKWLVQGNDFYSYWDGKGQPPSWAIYCGFVKKEMKPNFFLMDSRRLLMSGAF